MAQTSNNRKYKISGFEDSIISLILVTHNDEDIIVKRLTSIYEVLSLLNINYEILIIDNNSVDRTVSTIQKLKKVIDYTRIIILAKDYKKEIAITAGIDACIGDYAIVFDIYTDPIEMIPYILTNKLTKGTDIVIGKPSKEILKHDFYTRIFLYLMSKISRHEIYYQQHYLMGLSRKAISSIIRTRRKSRTFGYIQDLIGLTKETVEYQTLKIYKKKLQLQKESFFRIILTVFDISISNSFRPIRFLSAAGLLFSFIYILYVITIVILVFVFGLTYLVPQGWITLSTILGTTFFILFSILTIISEYIIRILSETRDEPLYFVSDEVNKSTILPKKKKLNIV